MTSSTQINSALVTRVFDDNAVENLVRQYCSDNIDNWEVLMVNDGKVICRFPWTDGKTYILKLWSTQGWQAKFKQWIGNSAVDRELNILRHLAATEIRVPVPVGWKWMSLPGIEYSQATVLEDLGPVVRVLETYKAYRETGDEAAAWDLEEQMINITAGLLENNVVDADHGMVNTIVTANKEVVRLDFEVASIVKNPLAPTKELVEMLRRIMITSAYAMQPDVDRLTSFGQRLLERVPFPITVVKQAHALVNQKMAEQRDQIGLDMRWELTC
jgi:hypothetical protein